MNKLSSEILMEAYVKAKEMNINQDFLHLIVDELTESGGYEKIDVNDESFGKNRKFLL